MGCPAVSAPPEGSRGCAGLDAVLARARTWLTGWPGGGPVPYLSSNAAGDLFDGYRRDCSGYVSMALGLPGPGLNTITLAARSTIIGKQDLQPGDLMIKPAPGGAGHVVLFAGWTDDSMSAYFGYEQSGDGGTHYRQIPYPYHGRRRGPVHRRPGLSARSPARRVRRRPGSHAGVAVLVTPAMLAGERASARRRARAIAMVTAQ